MPRSCAKRTFDRNRGAVPAFERLLDRVMMSVTASFAEGTLRIIGDGQDNAIVVSRTAGGTILVNDGAVPILGGPATVANTAHLHIVGAGGNDVISLNESNGPLPGAAIFGGAGNDTLGGGSGIDFVAGESGSDTAFLGAGDDEFQWNPGDGSDVVEGQGGRDAMNFNGSDLAEKFELSANGNRARFTRDLGNVAMDLNGVEEIDLHAFGGADAVTVNDQSATSVSAVNLDLSGAAAGAGDEIADAVILNGTAGDDFGQIASFDNATRIAAIVSFFPFVNITGADGAFDTLTVNTLGGNDVLDAFDLFATNANQLIKLIVVGGAGNDTVTGSQGFDTFVWNPGDGSDSIEGVNGFDTMIFNGSDQAERFELSADGSGVRLTRDLGGVAMELGGVEAVTLNPLGGADAVITGDLIGTVVTRVDLNLAGAAGGDAGDGQADSVIVSGTGGSDLIPVLGMNGVIVVNGDLDRGLPYFMVIRRAEAGDVLRIDGNAGNDTVAADLNDPVILRVDGGAQADTIDVVGTAPGGIVTVLPSSGDDTVNVSTDGAGVANVAFNATQRIGALNVGAGGVATIAPGGSKVLTVTSVSVVGNGRLDLTDNAMIVDYAGTTPVASVQALLRSGFNGGAWDGPGIVSSAAAAAPDTGIGFAEATDLFTSFPTAFKGQAIDGTSVLLTHTLSGDADLNGTVNLSDFNRLAANFGQSSRRWSRGDFDYNGNVNLSDFNRLAANFGRSGITADLRLG